MNKAKLVTAFIARNPMTWAFHIIMLAIGVAIVLSVVLFGRAIENRLERDLAGVDLVVGAKGSPTQLILSSLFATDAPTGNIDLEIAEKIAASPLVRESVMISLGDNASGFRIVGTSAKLADFYQAKLAKGTWWNKTYEVVIGAEVARGMRADIDTKFVGEHGLIGGGEKHGEHPYRVVGILAPTGSAIDKMVLTDTQSVWDIHAEHHHEEGQAEAEGAHDHESKKQITALLVRYKSAMGALMMPRQIGALPDIQAAIPAKEAARLTALTGAGSQVLQWLGIGLLALSASGFCIALANGVHQRRSEFALLRVLGIGPSSLVSLILLEALVMGLLAGSIGILIGRAMTWLGAQMIGANGGIMLTAPQFGLIDGLALVSSILLALLAALLPAIFAYRTDPALALKGNVG